MVLGVEASESEAAEACSSPSRRGGELQPPLPPGGGGGGGGGGGVGGRGGRWGWGMCQTAINKTAVDVIMMMMTALQPFCFPRPS